MIFLRFFLKLVHVKLFAFYVQLSCFIFNFRELVITMSAPPTPYYIEDCEPAPTYLSGSEDSELTPTYTGGSNRHEDCELIPTYQSKLEVNEVSQASSSKVVSTKSFVWLYFTKGSGYAECDFCKTKLTYQDGTTSNLKKHLKIHKTKVPELKESNVKKDSISVIDMLNNNNVSF